MWQDINRRNQVFSRYEKLFGKRILKLDFGGFLLGKTNGIFEKFFRWMGVFSALLGINEIQETTSHTSDGSNSFFTRGSSRGDCKWMGVQKRRRHFSRVVFIIFPKRTFVYHAINNEMTYRCGKGRLCFEDCAFVFYKTLFIKRFRRVF